MPYRCAELFCECCGKSLGVHDIVYTNLESNMFCGKCQRPYIRKTPFDLAENIQVVSDAGGFVSLRYVDGYYPDLTVMKECYFNRKGRYVKIKGKRHYLNLMPLPKKNKEGE